MGNLQRIIYLEQEDYDTLVNEGSITKSGRTITLNDNDLYITPEEETSGNGIDFVLSTNTSYDPDDYSLVGTSLVGEDEGEEGATVASHPYATLRGNLQASSLTNGKMIIYMTVLPLPNEDQCVKLTLSTGTETLAYPLYRYGTTPSNIPYPAGSCLLMVFYNNAFYLTTPTGVTI